MNFIIWMYLVSTIWPVQSYFFTGYKQVFKPPKFVRENSYFGYSITYDSFYKNLVVSSPRENNIGEVYTCNIANENCTAIDYDIDRASNAYTHDYWFGATVKAGPNFVIMCAPRYTIFTARYKKYVAFGTCYRYQNQSLTQMSRITEELRNKDAPLVMEAYMDSFGWSMDVGSDDSIIVGGPGMYHGRAMVYTKHKNKPTFTSYESRYTPEYNFGYGVAAGNFIRYDKLSYAVSSTYGTGGYGEILFFTLQSNKLVHFRKLEKVEDPTVVGSLFGAVLCAAKLGGGKKSDLLVGAPAYATTESYNNGAVYVYIGEDVSLKFRTKIVGQAPGASFGSAISNIGDLNGDKRDEIAIGAPFENKGRGVVYIYSGARLAAAGSDLTWIQRIEPEESYASSFGMSLTPLLDYDKNGCKELAVGSPYTDKVVLFRSMASVIVTTTAEFPILQGRSRLKKTDFTFNVCLNIKYPSLPEKVIAKLSTTVEMTHSHAKLKADSSGRITFQTSLATKLFHYCKDIPFILPLDGKYEMKINYQISTELLDDPRNLKTFDGSKVILSDLSTLNIRDSIWAAECAGKNDTCIPRLILTPNISFKYKDHVYVIGSSKTETVGLSVTNYGEVAYESCVRVHFVGATVSVVPPSCHVEDSTDGDRLRCEPPKPLQNNETWVSGMISLEMALLTNKIQQVLITTSLYNNCRLNISVDNSTMPVLVKADPSGIVVKGETDIGAVVDMKEDDIKKYGKSFQHIYTLSNKGITNWVDLQVQITLPVQPYMKYDENPITIIYLSSISNGDCKIAASKPEHIYYLCKVESLKVQTDNVKILIPMHILPGALDGILTEDNNMTIHSTISLQNIDEYSKDVSTTTTIKLKAATVPIEAIIIAVIVGLVILLVIAFILYRIGFLRRKKREELQRLRTSVKRQTILRRSTMPSQSQSSEDRKQILEELNEADETPKVLNAPQ